MFAPLTCCFLGYSGNVVALSRRLQAGQNPQSDCIGDAQLKREHVISWNALKLETWPVRE
jgi:hypothetical protein